MSTGDPKLRDQLRDLPTGYLLDLLADQDDIDPAVIREILRERGLEADEISALVRRRVNSRFPRGYVLWNASRIFTSASAVVVTGFNLFAYYRLLHSDSPLKGLLLALSVGGVVFGFFIGYKLTTHLYQGGPHQLDCGFPLAVGSVDLRTGRETVKPKLLMLLCMAVNAAVGVALVLFPLLLIHHLLN